MKTYIKRSFWLQEALADADEVPVELEESLKADVCIVGGGYTGLWTAVRLKEERPSLEVVVLERDICGGGASGRNGGFVLSWWAKFLTLEKLCGTEEALRLAKASAKAVEEIGEFCAAHHIEADYRRAGWLWSATSTPQIGSWNDTVQALERHGLTPYVSLNAGEAAHRTGSAVHLGGVLDPSGARVQPAKLARGLRRVACELGVKIYERTPLTRLNRSVPPVAHTPRGAVRAEKIVLALNAWGVRFPAIRRAIAVGSSDMVITEPVPEILGQNDWTDGLVISDSRMLVHYYRTTGDGRVAFGKGGGPVLAFGGRVGSAFDGESPIAKTVATCLEKTYPQLRGVSWKASWMGPIARSKSGLPLFGRIDGRSDILFGAGYSGNGVGPAVIGGRILASLVLERRDEWAGSGLVVHPQRDFPPEPIRYVGGHLVRRAVILKDRAEDQHRKPGFLVKHVAALAPRGLSPTKRTPPEDP